MTNNLDKIQLFLDQTSSKIGAATTVLSPLPRLNDAIKRFHNKPSQSNNITPMEQVAAIVAPPTKSRPQRKKGVI
jgi:hypothetical protein